MPPKGKGTKRKTAAKGKAVAAKKQKNQYKKKLIDLAEEIASEKRRIGVDGARKLWKSALDGGIFSFFDNYDAFDCRSVLKAIYADILNPSFTRKSAFEPCCLRNYYTPFKEKMCSRT